MRSYDPTQWEPFFTALIAAAAALTAIATVPATIAGISLTAHWGGGF